MLYPLARASESVTSAPDHLPVHGKCAESEQRSGRRLCGRCGPTAKLSNKRRGRGPVRYSGDALRGGAKPNERPEHNVRPSRPVFPAKEQMAQRKRAHSLDQLQVGSQRASQRRPGELGRHRLDVPVVVFVGRGQVSIRLVVSEPDSCARR